MYLSSKDLRRSVKSCTTLEPRVNDDELYWPFDNTDFDRTNVLARCDLIDESLSMLADILNELRMFFNVSDDPYLLSRREFVCIEF